MQNLDPSLRFMKAEGRIRWKSDKDHLLLLSPQGPCVGYRFSVVTGKPFMNIGPFNISLRRSIEGFSSCAALRLAGLPSQSVYFLRAPINLEFVGLDVLNHSAG